MQKWCTLVVKYGIGVLILHIQSWGWNFDGLDMLSEVLQMVAGRGPGSLINHRLTFRNSLIQKFQEEFQNEASLLSFGIWCIQNLKPVNHKSFCFIQFGHTLWWMLISELLHTCIILVPVSLPQKTRGVNPPNRWPFSKAWGPKIMKIQSCPGGLNL